MFQGLRTVIYHPGDMEKAKAWYSKVLEKAPYFDSPEYVGFNVGGYELGLFIGGASPAQDKEKEKEAAGLAYWGVADIEKAHARLLELGAKAHSPITDVGGDILMAAVLDPFGNQIGLIYNPHFKLETP
jgi:predicted enzyme related to lactoylglutathione lyase